MSTAARPSKRDRVPSLIAWGLGLLCLLAIANRFRMGTDLTDETFSIALPYRFVLGDRPFVDEISIQQTAGIILFPFVWLYVKITGGTTGIVLFVRAVHLLLFKGAAAVSVHEAARRWLKHRSTAIAVSFVPFAFVPHSIPNVGYNVIGMSLLTAGTFLMAAGVAEPDDRVRMRCFFLGGCALGIMSFAYPPMVVAPLLATPLVLILAQRRLSSSLALAAGGVTVLVAVLPSLAFGGIAGVRRSLAWGVHANATATSDKLREVAVRIWDGTPSFFVYAAAAVFVAWVIRSRLLVALVLPAVTLAIGFYYRDEAATSRCAIHTVMYAGILAPLALVLARPDRAVLGGSALVLVPSFAAAFAASMISTQQVDASSLAFQTPMVLFALLAARALERAGADRTYAMFPGFALIVVLVSRNYDYVYRDAPLAQLTDKVPSGPFKGIYTTRDRARMFAELQQITRTYDRPEGRILFMYESPGLYLFSKMPPAAHSVWQEFYGDQQGLLEYWRRYPKGQGIVVRIKGVPAGVIDPELTIPGRREVETPHFIVYRDHD